MPQHPSAPAPSAPPISGQEADRSPDLDRGPEAVRVTAPAIARNGAPEVAPDVTRPDSVGAVAGPVAADEDDPGRPDFDEIDTGAGLELETAPGRLAAGTDVIRRFVKTLPNAPGVYRMIGADGAVLYVGKARKLKARVSNYMRGYGHTARLARMISATVAMEFVTTATETEALLLETNYIKQLKPRFNVLMRDDKSFPFILLTGDHAAPQILKHRGARTRKGDYYGPFASAWAVKRTIDALQKAFLIRTCSDSVYENRTRPCLLHQIKRCAAPCTGEVSIAEYNSLVGDARAFLSGKSRAVKETMAGAMQAAAEALEFEQAARYRDRLAALSAITATQDINPANVEEADVLAVHEEAGVFCIEVFFFRTGQNWGNRAFFPRADRGMEPAEVLEGFLAQFYDERPPPRLILLSHAPEDAELLAEAFSQKAGQRVEILVPKRGEKRDLVEHALTNARDELGRRLAETQSQAKLSALLAEALGLAAPPKRIDVFDNSHIMGTNAVGGMIVHGPNGYAKTHYRTFNIQSTALTPGDDFGMMREVLTRRYSRLLKEHPRGEAPAEIDPEAVPAWPDLILIDGGPGQLGVAREVFDTLGITDVPLVGIAKGLDRDAGRETFHIKGRPPFKLPPRDPALYFVQRLRDEAHRFAIGTHRAKRKKALTKSPLDEIGGIGPARKRALLLHFGTAKAVSRASLQDLQGAPGINAATAKLVYDFFNESAR